MRRQPLHSSNARRLARVRRLKPDVSGSYWGHALTFSPDGHWLISIPRLSCGQLRWWNLLQEDEAPCGTLPLSAGPVVPLSSRGGSKLLITQGHLLQEWSLTTGQLEREAALGMYVGGLVLSADESTLLIAGDKGAVWLWDRVRWERERTLEMCPDSLSSCALSPDGRLAAAGAWSRDQIEPSRVFVWDVNTGALLSQIPIEAYSLSSVAFHPSLPLLVVGIPSHGLQVVDPLKESVVRTMEPLGTASVGFDREGDLLVAGGTGFSVMDFSTGVILYEHSDDNDEQYSSAVLSPDGCLIAWGEGDRTIGLWGIPD